MITNKAYIWAIALLAIVIIAGVLAKTYSTEPSSETIKIGGISALTGVGVGIGEEERKGALLAVEEVNSRGGIQGHKLELVSEDVSLDKMKNAVSVVQKLITTDGVVAIVGPQWDEPAFPMLPIIEQAKVPMVGADSSPMLEADKPYEYFFSTWYDNRVGIRELLRFAEKRGLKRLAIIKPIGAGFWEYTASIMKSEAHNFGVQIVYEEDMGNPLLTDFRTSILKVKQKNPDAIFIVTSDYNQCAFLEQAEQIGYTGVTLGTESSGDPVSITQCPRLLEKRYFSTPVHAESYAGFAERFKSRFGEYPRFPSASTAYDAVMVIADGLSKSDLNGGQALRDAVAGTKNLPGVSMPMISFDEIGFVSTPEDGFEIQTVKDGKFVGVQ